MGKGHYLGEFEIVVMSALIQLGEEAYGVRVRDEIKGRGGREVSIPTVYTALERLERKGLVSSRLGDATPERGGRAKRFFRVESAGHIALEESRALMERMWEGLGPAREAH